MWHACVWVVVARSERVVARSVGVVARSVGVVARSEGCCGKECGLWQAVPSCVVNHNIYHVTCPFYVY